MPSITDVINKKYGVEGFNIADALCKAGKVAVPTDNVADAFAAFADAGADPAVTPKSIEDESEI